MYAYAMADVACAGSIRASEKNTDVSDGFAYLVESLWRFEKPVCIEEMEVDYRRTPGIHRDQDTLDEIFSMAGKLIRIEGENLFVIKTWDFWVGGTWRRYVVARDTDESFVLINDTGHVHRRENTLQNLALKLVGGESENKTFFNEIAAWIREAKSCFKVTAGAAC